MNDRCILVTGGTGFLGIRLVKRLVAMGYEVHLLVRSSSSLADLRDVVPPEHFHEVGIEQDRLNSVLSRIRPHRVVHLAAQWLVKPGEVVSESLVKSNVLYPAMLLEAMQYAGVKHLVNAASFWQYYDNQPYSPVDLYAATKQAFEAIAQFYAEARGFKILHLVVGNTYGEDDPRPKLIPALQSGRSLALSPGEQIVEFLHVDDVVSGFVVGLQHIIAQKDYIERYALRPDRAYSLKQLISVIESVTGDRLPVEWGGRPYREREMMEPVTLWPVLPGWEPRISVEEGMARVFKAKG